MRYKDVVADFAERTRKNLEVIKDIQKKQKDSQVFEVTQLINSMLGLLVFPKEAYFNKIPAISLSQIAKQGWPIPNVRAGYLPPKTLRDMIRLLRNAIAHFNLEFTIDKNDQISGLVVWNEYEGTKTWEAELSIADLEGITLRFIDLLKKR